MILFAAIPIPHGLTRDLARMQQGVGGARWVAPERFHITLGYFNDVDDERAELLDGELARLRLAPFELRLAGAGHFGQAEPHSIWIGVEGHASLTRLNDHCKTAARRVGLPMERRVYRPHVTLAYMRGQVAIDRIIAFEQRLAGYRSDPMLVDGFALWSSHRRSRGPNIYREEATYPLLG